MLSMTKKMNRIIGSMEHFMHQPEYWAQYCISYKVTENRALHFISRCKIYANKCWLCTTNVLREALNVKCVIPIATPTCLWEIASFVSLHPTSTNRASVVLKSHTPSQCCIFPEHCCPARSLTEWHQYVWILNTKHDLHHQPCAQPVPCSPCCLALTLANLLLTGTFWKTGQFFFYPGSEKCPSLQHPREWE